MAPFMADSWEGKSSWAGVGSTKPGRVFVYWVDFTSIGGKGGYVKFKKVFQKEQWKFMLKI
jgi:acetyl-CoA carboxylase carboxyltransferase component